jgi:hypothetical protein
MVGDIDERRLEFHQRIEVIVNGADGSSFQGRKYFEGDKGSFCLLQMLYNLHKCNMHRALARF